jgi:hypothetical protein
MSILKLPTEIVLEVAAYLDWAKEDLCPTKPDVVNLSMTCSQLRDALIPTVFRDVILKLYWQGGILAEPCLYKLRLHCPHLAKHIRSVCIVTNFDHDDLSPHGSRKSTPFVAPFSRPDWLNLASDICPSMASVRSEYRKRANRAASKFASLESFEQQDPGVHAEQVLGLATAQSTSNKAGLDALTIGQFPQSQKERWRHD